jgi:AcrR family transcriptional regulator
MQLGRQGGIVARPYRLGKRAVTIAATRQRILESARELIQDQGLEGANIQAIAKQAGVTRPTVYQQFGSQQELMLAVMHDAIDRADVRSVRKALQLPDAGQAVRGMLRGSCRFWDSEFTLFSRFKGLATMEASAATVDRQKEQVRRGHVENIIGRLHNDGLLRQRLGRKEAVERLYLLSSFEVFERLRSAGNTVEATAVRLIDLAEQTILVPPSVVTNGSQQHSGGGS